ncbi:MAG: bifunctional adenosylcobinamide kinase/adenosylcobinamide-phosphate guanylyltransferase [Ruminococcus flavefaciens]|nr:bifunctional adenosylcobinamide kinase/adenosylcobinamide-phosphate guanylyltransferase [Ruminococcus flavefaciens]
MIMITGGAYSGKNKFVHERLSVPENLTKDGRYCTFGEIFTAVCVNNYHILVKRLISENIEPIGFTEKLCMENNNIIIIMDEIGCGIVPVEKGERKWREMCGKCGCIIAENSETVVRMACGIGKAIKGKI